LKPQPQSKTLPQFALSECSKTLKRDDKRAAVDEEGLDLRLGKFAQGCGANAGPLHFVRREVYNPTKRTDLAAPNSRSVEKEHSESHESR
jgi:hypothetical protein